MVKTLPSKAGGVSLTPGQGIKIPNASQPKNQNIKQKQYCNKFNNSGIDVNVINCSEEGQAPQHPALFRTLLNLNASWNQ